jgi:hypothetical protein
MNPRIIKNGWCVLFFLFFGALAPYSLSAQTENNDPLTLLTASTWRIDSVIQNGKAFRDNSQTLKFSADGYGVETLSMPFQPKISNKITWVFASSDKKSLRYGTTDADVAEQQVFAIEMLTSKTMRLSCTVGGNIQYCSVWVAE